MKGYTFNGHEVLDVDADFCFAKIIDGEDNSLYYVKQCIEGVNNGKYFNHRDMHYRNGDESRMTKSGRGKIYQFKKVNKEQFDHYLTFLKTENQAWLRNMRRVSD